MFTVAKTVLPKVEKALYSASVVLSLTYLQTC